MKNLHLISAFCLLFSSVVTASAQNADSIAVSRIFGNALSTIETPDTIVEQVGPIHAQFLCTDVWETPEAILAELAKRMN